MLNTFDNYLEEKNFQKGTRTDRHHILFPRKKWDRGYAKRLRDVTFLKAELPISIHRSLHQEISPVPLPPQKYIKEMFLILEDLRCRNYLEKDASMIERINLLLSVWQKYPSCQQTCNALIEQKKFMIRQE